MIFPFLNAIWLLRCPNGVIFLPNFLSLYDPIFGQNIHIKIIKIKNIIIRLQYPYNNVNPKLLFWSNFKIFFNRKKYSRII